MTPAMPARNTDCTAKRRMLVSNMRWPIMSSCTTSINAAIRVMSCAPTGVEMEGPIKSLEQERGQQRQRRQNKSGAEQVRHAEQAQLGVGGLDHDHRSGQQKEFHQVGQRAESQPGDCCVGGEAKRKEDV